MSSLAHQLDRGLVGYLALCCCPILSFVWSFCVDFLFVHQPDVGVIVRACSNIVPSGRGLRPEHMLVFVCFCFYFLLLLCSLLGTPFLSYLFFLLFSGVRMKPCILLSCRWYGMTYHGSLVPFPCVLMLRCTCAKYSFHLALVCFLASRRFFFF